MGLQKEIEDVYRQTLESDLERISRSAEPSYHYDLRPPRAMALVEQIHPGGRAGDLQVRDVDYQIVKIELVPLEIKQDEENTLEPALSLIKERRIKRRVSPSQFEAGMRRQDYHAALHAYAYESNDANYDPIVISTRRLEGGVPLVISIDGVQYVSDEVFKKSARISYEQVKEYIYQAPMASVDQWPEEVEIHSTVPREESRKYIRVDVKYVEAQNEDPVNNSLRQIIQ